MHTVQDHKNGLDYCICKPMDKQKNEEVAISTLLGNKVNYQKKELKLVASEGQNVGGRGLLLFIIILKNIIWL